MSDISSPLAQILRDEILRTGPMSFRDFMERALYDPEHGYYGSGKARVGRSGDFFTNVSVGSLFGRLLARQFIEIWRQLGEPKDFVLVEQGAHDGTCAADVLGGLREFEPACFAATTLWIVEPLAASKERQAETLREFPEGKICWAGDVAQLPPFVGVHYSNELVDAFPVHRVAWRGDHWVERKVGFVEDRLSFVDTGISEQALHDHLAKLPPTPESYETEINLAAAPWVTEVASRLQAGYFVVVDYGFARAEYYRPERTDGTLSAYAAHQRVSDPLERPGEIDLTAHVDFTTLAAAARLSGLQIAGFTDQHHFIVGLSRLHFPDDAALATASPKEVRAFKTLMHPGLMGRSFQVLGLAKNASPAGLAGFQFAGNAETKLFTNT